MTAIYTLETIATALTTTVAQLTTELRRLRREVAIAELDVDAGPPPEPEVTSGTDATSRRMVALRIAEEEWRRGVREPPGKGWTRIDEYIRGEQGLGWTWENAYIADRQFAWCGAFAAWCFGAAGLKPLIRRDVMPSCYRLNRWAKGTTRMLKPEDIEPGDIAIVGPEGGKRWGNHITLCTGVTGSGLETIEGNAWGESVNGERYQGVVRMFRPFALSGAGGREYRVMYGVRLLEEDFG